MSDTTAFLLRALEENWILARQAEDKRAVIAHVNDPMIYYASKNVPESYTHTLE